MFQFFIFSKKQITALLLILIFIVVLLSWALSSERSGGPMDFNKIIVVDPGHGGIDPGCHHGSLLEKEITLEIALKLKKELQRANFQVVMTRTEDKLFRDDRNQDIHYRYRLANQVGADLFISIHVNKYPSSQPAGAQTFYYSEEDKFLAVHIQEALKKINPVNNRTIQRGDFLVLKNTRAPGVIVEVGFISNPSDRKRITDPLEQHQIGRAITQGIISYFRQRLFQLPEEQPQEETAHNGYQLRSNYICLPVYFGNNRGEITSKLLQLDNIEILSASAGKSLVEVVACRVIEMMIKEPDGLISPLPTGTRLLSANLKGNTLILDFSHQLSSNHWGGSSGELLTLNCLGKTFTQLPEVKRVKILIEGEEKTVGGHIYP